MRLKHIAAGALGILWATSLSVMGVRVLPASLHLEQAAGSVETYTLTVLNDTNVAEELTLYVGDWQRLEDGEHDWGIPINSARWIFDRSFVAGEAFEITYSMQTDSMDELTITGKFESQAPQSSNTTSGPDTLLSIAQDATAPSASADTVWVTRSIVSIDEGGLATVRLHVQCIRDFEGLVLYETTSQRAQFRSMDDAGARFDTINRSNAEWLTLSHDRLVLQPDESREINLTIAMPDGSDGTTWSALFVQSQPQTTDEGGTRVISIYRTAIKIYTTAIGSDSLAGSVVDVQVGESSSLVLFALFENTGNVELVVTGTVQVIDRSGQVIRDMVVEEFKVLPDAKRIITIADSQDASPLPADIYQAVVSLDYGGDSPVVGVRGFRIR